MADASEQENKPTGEDHDTEPRDDPSSERDGPDRPRTRRYVTYSQGDDEPPTLDIPGNYQVKKFGTYGQTVTVEEPPNTDSSGNNRSRRYGTDGETNEELSTGGVDNETDDATSAAVDSPPTPQSRQNEPEPPTRATDSSSDNYPARRHNAAETDEAVQRPDEPSTDSSFTSYRPRRYRTTDDSEVRPNSRTSTVTNMPYLPYQSLQGDNIASDGAAPRTSSSGDSSQTAYRARTDRTSDESDADASHAGTPGSDDNSSSVGRYRRFRTGDDNETDAVTPPSGNQEGSAAGTGRRFGTDDGDERENRTTAAVDNSSLPTRRSVSTVNDPGDHDNRDSEDTADTDPDKGKKKVWSPDEIQSLFIKAINFRSSMRDIRTVLKCGADVNRAINSGLRPLHYAAYTDNVDCVDLLLEYGADVNATDDIGYTPIHLSARRGNYATLEKLIDNGAIINYNEPGTVIRNTDEKNKLGYTTSEPLNLALQNYHAKCAELLIKKGARVDCKYFMGYEICLTPLDNPECLEVLLKYGADPNVHNRCGLCPLMKACKDHHIEAVRTLLKYGADINAQCPELFEQKSVIHYAINSGNIVIINILLGKGVKVGRHPDYKFSALHSAVLKGRADICRVLLQYGADVNERTDEGATSLMIACSTPDMKERKEVVQMLVNAGADVNSHAPTFSFLEPHLSPLAEYFKCVGSAEDFDIVELLVNHGAIVHFNSCHLDLKATRSPFSLLTYCQCLVNHYEIFDLLLEAASAFSPLSIHASENIPEDLKDELLFVSTRPRGLKHLVRLAIRNRLGQNIPDKIDLVPLPPILKTYLSYTCHEHLQL